jgi:dsRNA-specific ribonuclease
MLINIEATKRLLYSKDFEKYILDTLLYRCLFKPIIVTKYFNTTEGWALFRQAFTNSSYDSKNNHELLESEGDPLVNRAIYKFIRDEMKHVDKLEWRTRLFGNFKSKQYLSQLAVQHDFQKFVLYGQETRDDFQKQLNKKVNLLEYNGYMSIYEDAVEALCGAIGRIGDKYLYNGTTEAACNNLIGSYMRDSDMTHSFESSFEQSKDFKTRLKEDYFDEHWKTPSPSCEFKNCFETHKITGNPNVFRKYLEVFGTQADKSILNTKSGFLSYGYLCLDGKTKKFYAVATGGNANKAEQNVAEKLIHILDRMGYKKKG